MAVTHSESPSGARIVVGGVSVGQGIVHGDVFPSWHETSRDGTHWVITKPKKCTSEHRSERHDYIGTVRS
jgi:hypothetical protein